MNAGTPTPERDYSSLTIEYLQNPNRLWAFPVIGGAVKLVIVLPVSMWLLIVDFAAIILSIVNAFFCALYRQVLGACLYARCGLNAAHCQSQLLLSRPQRYVPWVFAQV